MKGRILFGFIQTVLAAAVGGWAVFMALEGMHAEAALAAGVLVFDVLTVNFYMRGDI